MNPWFRLVPFCSLFTIFEAIYSTQQQRMSIQRQGENRREDKVSNYASYMALITLALSAAVLEYGMFLCKVGRIKVHCQVKSLFFNEIGAEKFSGGE